jgi:GNAT superfamily N-acetyltransferase
MIRSVSKNDFASLFEIINNAAIAYKKILSDEHWHEPYMSVEELSLQITDGVQFYCWCESDSILGVMGFQDKGSVQLIRHAYVKTSEQGKGIGGKLMRHLIDRSEKPLLVGTWKKAVWAIEFYEKHGFVRVGDEESRKLLKLYWKIPLWHAETSLVLALNWS